jgi:hypothetical protein
METLTCFNKEIRKAKRSSWRRYCQINDVPGSARLMKVMVKQATNKVSTIKLPDGKHTHTGNGTLKELFRVHFPDSKLTDDSGDRGQQNLGACGHITNGGDWNLAKHVIIKQSKIRWALDSSNHMSAGTDGTVPALLQQTVEYLVPHLCSILRVCMVHGFIPMAWRQVKVTLYSKAQKLDHTDAKAYRPISLSSFLLKTMEKLVD